MSRSGPGGRGYRGAGRPTDAQGGPGFFDPDDQEAAPVEAASEAASGGRAKTASGGGRLVVEADGGSRGNPGPAAYGALVRQADTLEVLSSEGWAIGVATNNVAEYRGLIAGLEMAQAINPDAEVEVRMDSKLVVEQMAGRWKIKHPSMIPLARRARELRPTRITWTWVPRASNSAADALVNSALDGEPVTRAVGVPPLD